MAAHLEETARTLETVDHAIGALLAAAPAIESEKSAAIQAIDRIVQEIAGMGHVLGLLADRADPQAAVDLNRICEKVGLERLVSSLASHDETPHAAGESYQLF